MEGLSSYDIVWHRHNRYSQLYSNCNSFLNILVLSRLVFWSFSHWGYRMQRIYLLHVWILFSHLHTPRNLYIIISTLANYQIFKNDTPQIKYTHVWNLGGSKKISIYSE